MLTKPQFVSTKPLKSLKLARGAFLISINVYIVELNISLSVNYLIQFGYSSFKINLVRYLQ